MDYVWYELVYNFIGDANPSSGASDTNVIDGTGVTTVIGVTIRNCEPILT